MPNPTLAQRISIAIKEADNLKDVSVVYNGCRYNNISLRDGKPVAWRANLITGQARFVNI